MAAGPSGSAMQAPFLVHDAGGDAQALYFTVAGGQPLVVATPMDDVLRHHRCFETPQGWVLAVDPRSTRAFLCHPHDGDRISLPPMPADRAFPDNCTCLLTGNPTDAAGSGCFVVLLNLDDTDYFVCPVGGEGGSWHCYGYVLTMYDADDKPCERHMARRHGVAAVGGKLYFQFSGSELGVVDFQEEPDGEPSISFIEVDMVDTHDAAAPMWSSYLLESRGDLFLAVVFFDGHNVHKVTEVAVYKMDFSAAPAEWRRVDSIGGDQAFVLSGGKIGVFNFGASCTAGDGDGPGLRGDCIYFVNHIAIEENFVHIIDLTSGAQEVLRPFRGLPTPLRPPFWILPPQH